MGWILMQPAHDKASIEAALYLQKMGHCKFDFSLHGAQLKPIEFGSRSCNDYEKNFHYFTGKGVSGRWAITQNRK